MSNGRVSSLPVSEAALQQHTGFGDCTCPDCYPSEPECPLAEHGKPLGFWRTIWLVVRGLRLYG